uniref:Methyltransferase n=1 Tax=viral metagenome TaxID=1070528 RepID=A0A6M3J380_9ZZZZ
MKILIACEESQIVTEQFINAGFDTMSCDLLPGAKGLPHYQGDLFDIINDDWHAIIVFPPCTHLSGAGAPSWKQKQADGRQQQAVDFVMKIWNNKCGHISIENPTGFLNTNWRKPNQIINPFQFGDPFKKRTCLWLKNLPDLLPTKIVEPKWHYTSNSTRGGLLKDGTRRKSKLPIRKAWDNSNERSKFFTGISQAMVNQWGNFLMERKRSICA